MSLTTRNVQFNTYGGGQSRLRVVHMEKDMQVMIITIDLLTQKNVTTAQCTNVQSRKCSN